MVKKTKDVRYFEGVGRRKEATARVRLYITGKDKTVTVGTLKVKIGEIYLNKQPIDKVFPYMSQKTAYLNPLKLTDSEERFAVIIVSSGGGQNGQLDAIVQGMARALEKVDHDTYRPILKKDGLLSRDPRVRERRKVGTGGKARRAKQSPKR